MGKDQRREIARRWQEDGVILEDPDSLYAEPEVTVGAGTLRSEAPRLGVGVEGVRVAEVPKAIRAGGPVRRAEP